MIIVKELQKEYDNTVVLDIPHLNIIRVIYLMTTICFQP